MWLGPYLKWSRCLKVRDASRSPALSLTIATWAQGDTGLLPGTQPTETGAKITFKIWTYGRLSGPILLPFTSMCFSHWIWGCGSLYTLHMNSTLLPRATVLLAGNPACRMGR